MRRILRRGGNQADLITFGGFCVPPCAPARGKKERVPLRLWGFLDGIVEEVRELLNMHSQHRKLSILLIVRSDIEVAFEPKKD